MRRGTHKRGAEAAASRLRNAAGLRHVFAIVAALLAVFAQAFISQTHIHLPQVSSYASFAEQGSESVAPSQAGTESPAAPSHDREHTCEICQTLAIAGFALISAGPDLVSSLQSAPDAAPSVAAFVHVRRGYSWQSRAPPFDL